MAAIDLPLKAQQGCGRRIHLSRSQFDLNRPPTAVAQLHHRIHLDSVVVAVMEHLAIQGLGKYPQVANHQRLEQQPQQLQIVQESICTASKGRNRQGGVAEMALAGLTQRCLGTQVGAPGRLAFQHHQALKRLQIVGHSARIEGPLDPRTVTDYLETLERLMVLESQPAWRPHLRSKATLRQASKRHFCDPSLAVAALGGSADRLLNDLELLGLLFESLVIRDLRVFAQALDGEVFHYRDNYGVEVDAVVQLRDGRWGAIEIKLGSAQVDAAAASLLRFQRQIDRRQTGEPAFLAVICGKGYGYRRPDGVVVIPIGALAP